jgi:GMP synthase-like glutamine amidotransferase
MRYRVLQHVSFETAGLLAAVVRERGHSVETTALYAGEPLPSMAEFDGLIIMGGPMSVHDEDVYPWLKAEKELIAAAIYGGKRVLGICLGAQLIAAVCGARVYPCPQKEIGFWPVKWASGAEEEVFHWHGETFDLPPGAELLASTEVCANQAFRIGDTVLGIQFHPEVTAEIVRRMVENEGWELVEGGYVQGAGRILAGVEEMGEAEGAGLDIRGVGKGGSGLEWLWAWL